MKSKQLKSSDSPRFAQPATFMRLPHETDLTDVDVAIARTDPGFVTGTPVEEIRQLYVDAMQAALLEPLKKNAELITMAPAADWLGRSRWGRIVAVALLAGVAPLEASAQGAQRTPAVIATQMAADGEARQVSKVMDAVAEDFGGPRGMDRQGLRRFLTLAGMQNANFKNNSTINPSGRDINFGSSKDLAQIGKPGPLGWALYGATLATPVLGALVVAHAGDDAGRGHLPGAAGRAVGG